MGSTKKHKIRESKKRKHRSRSNTRSPERPDRSKHRHHKKHHKDRKKEKIIKDKNGELIPKYDNYDSEGKLHIRLSFFFSFTGTYSANLNV